MSDVEVEEEVGGFSEGVAEISGEKDILRISATSAVGRYSLIILQSGRKWKVVRRT